MSRAGRSLVRLLDGALRERVDAGGTTPAVGPPPPDTADEAREVIDLAARLGEVALASGSSAADCAAMVLRVVLTFGVRAHVDVTYNALTISYTHPDEINPITRMRIVTALGMDYDMLAWVERRVDALCEGTLTVAEARTLLHNQRRVRPLYRGWVMLVAAAVQGVTIALLIGGGLGEALAAAVGALLVESATRQMVRAGHSVFLRHVMAGALPTAIGLALMWARVHGPVFLWELSPSLVVASSMVTMLAGTGIVGAAQDALDGYYITAGARGLDFVARTGGLVLGVAGTLWLGVAAGVPAYLAAEWHPAPSPLVQLASVPFMCITFAMMTWLGPRAALVCGLIGAGGWLAYLGALAIAGNYAVAAGVMAVAVALLAQLVGRRLGVPVIAGVTAGIVPLVPGLMLYRALYGYVTGNPMVTASDHPTALLTMAMTTGLALALGASLGVKLGRRFARPERLVERLANAWAWTRGSRHGVRPDTRRLQLRRRRRARVRRA